MAVIHLDFGIDSDVHPELHAMLAVIGSGASRGERLRQLAATGLVWEAIRIQGHAASVGHATSAQSDAEAAADADDHAIAARTPGEGASRVDFVDLAIDAVPVPAAASSDPPASLVFARALADEASQLPVLVDVVEFGPASRPVVSTDPVDDAPNISSIARGPATMSRLMRMKEKGLFKNG